MKVNVKCFVTAIAVIFALMVFTYVLTFIVPAGQYNPDTLEFVSVEGGLPFYKWVLSPILVLTVDGSSTLIAIIAFLFVIGGVFECLDKCGFMKYMLGFLSDKFKDVKYKFMAVLMLFFMLMGAFIGSFEEVVPMVPIVVALSIKLGWDALTGISMSLLAVGCGFATGICNPFTVGIAQRLAGLAMFSGIWMRAVSFVFIYCLLLLFVRNHAKNIEKESSVLNVSDFVYDKQYEKALITFASIIAFGIAVVLSSSFITALQDYTMIIVALMFLVSGVTSCIIVKMKSNEFFKTFLKGCVSILPSVLMILMASSIKYTLTEAHIQDTLLYMAINQAQHLPKVVLVLFLYAVVLIMNFFIGSGSAKAFMMIPLLVPLANAFGISSQLCIMAFAFGDGFSNVFYPTNAALLISLGLVDVDYTSWAKYSWKFQGLNLILTSALLIFAFSVGY